METLKKFNKGTAAALAGAIVTILVILGPMFGFDVSKELQALIHSFVATVFVILFPRNAEDPVPVPEVKATPKAKPKPKTTRKKT